MRMFGCMISVVLICLVGVLCSSISFLVSCLISVLGVVVLLSMKCIWFFMYMVLVKGYRFRLMMICFS